MFNFRIEKLTVFGYCTSKLERLYLFFIKFKFLLFLFILCLVAVITLLFNVINLSFSFISEKINFRSSFLDDNWGKISCK